MRRAETIHIRRDLDADGGALLAAVACVMAALLLYAITLLLVGSIDDDEPLDIFSLGRTRHLERVRSGLLFDEHGTVGSAERVTPDEARTV